MPRKKKQTPEEQQTSSETPEWSDVAQASADVAATADVKVREFSQDLEVPCDPKETAENAQRLVMVLATIDQITAEKKEATREFNEHLKTEKALASKLAESVRLSTTTKKVPCRETWFFATGKAEIRRLDTNELLDERALLAEERQGTIDFDGQQTRTLDPEPAPETATDIGDPAAVLAAEQATPFEADDGLDAVLG